MGESSEPSTDAQSSKLFQPIKVGDVTLAHRVVFAPMTRLRANTRGVHGDLAVEYYAQRASVPGSLLISEATYVSRQAEGRSPNAPGIWNEEQIAGWKRVSAYVVGQGRTSHAAVLRIPKVVDAVHAKGSYIYMQIWGLGRAARLGYIRERDPDFAYVAASDVPLAGREEVPRPLTVEGTRRRGSVLP